jgi:hypothetical protein
MARLQYPLERQGEFKGRVVFELLEVQPLEAGSIAELGFIEKVFSEDTISRIQKNTDDESTSGTSEIEKEKLKSDLKAADKQLQGDENRTYEKTGTTRNTGDRVVLYLPQTIQIQDAVTYENLSLGMMGAGVEAGVKGGGSVVGSTVDAAGAGVSSFISAMGGGTALEGPLARLAMTQAANLGGDQIGGAVRGLTRTAVNPNARTLFRDVPIRSIPFSFRMVATSQKEAEEIKKIVKFFRTEMYPEEITTQLAGQDLSIGYKFPNPFKIKMQYNKKQVANQFLDCYLQAFSATYNQNGPVMHSDGNFVEVDISMTFIETRALSRKKIEEGL